MFDHMKKILIPLCLMAVASAGVQAQVKAGKGLVVTSNSAVAYSLPRTTLKVTVEVEKRASAKGLMPLCAEIPRRDGSVGRKDIYTITGGKDRFLPKRPILHRCIRWKIRIKVR